MGEYDGGYDIGNDSGDGDGYGNYPEQDSNTSYSKKKDGKAGEYAANVIGWGLSKLFGL